MGLKDQRFLIIDCQTTGMRPSVGHLLEIAWAWASADVSPEELQVHEYLVQLPEGGWLPPRVSEITGIKNSDLTDAHDVEFVREKFLETLKEASASSEGPVTALIHYCQFEEPFLIAFLNLNPLPFDFLCTHKLAKKIYPTVPSRNIRGLTGFFGSRIGEIKRAGQHVRATHLIWQGIAKSLSELGRNSLEDVRSFLAETPPKRKKGEAKPKAPSYEYRVDRAKRLALPDRPGIYKMKDKDGAILYVGKATSLKDRVNSYFRGKKGRDARKLEMMAQVWDLETVECGSAIEAALIESDEIKRLDPPYNVSLKGARRSMQFYSHDLESDSVEQNQAHLIGPFRRFNAVDSLRTFVRGLKEDVLVNVFHQPIEDEVMVAGYEMFAEKYPEIDFDSGNVRKHLAYGLLLLRSSLRSEKIPLQTIEALDEAELETDTEIRNEEVLVSVDEELTAEELVEKFERLYTSAASSYLRSKRLTKLLWADLTWTEKGQTKNLSIRNAKVGRNAQAIKAVSNAASIAVPWAGLEMPDYDRMSILLSEMARFPHEIYPF